MESEVLRYGNANGLLLLPVLLQLGTAHPYVRADPFILVVDDDQRPLASMSVDVCEDGFAACAVVPCIVDVEMLDTAEEVAPSEQGEYPPVVLVDHPLVRLLVPVCPPVLHAVLLLQTLYLAMAEHRQTGQRGEYGADGEVAVAVAELCDRGLLVGVVHEVHIALEDLGFEDQGVLDRHAVLLVLLVLEHVHEGRVVDAVHAQCADEIALHHPEGLCEKQRVWNLVRNAVDHLPPELLRNPPVELLVAEGVHEPAGDVSSVSGLGVPEPLDVALGKRHRRIEADYVEVPGNVQDLLDDGLSGHGIEVVQLCGVVPGHRRAVVAVEDIAGLACPPVDAAEGDCRIAPVIVVVLDLDLDVRVGGQVRSVERV